MRIALRSALASVLLCLLGTAPALAKDYVADRFDVHVRVLPGNLLEVTETVVFRFDGTFDHVFRELPARRTDGIEIVRASMDGRPFPLGAGRNEADVSGRSKVRVQWRFDPVSDTSHTFGLTYRVRGAVERQEGHDELGWQALPTTHEYPIASSTIAFVFPEALADSGPLDPPSVEWHRVEGDTSVTPAAAEAGPGAPAYRLSAGGIRSNGWVMARFSVPQNSLIIGPPDWQQQELRTRALSMWWLAGAGGIGLVALFVLFGIRQHYDAPPGDLEPAAGTAPPERMETALAGALVSNGHSSNEHAMATLFELAERGVVDIEEQPGRRLGGHTFLVRRHKDAAAPRGHGAVLLDILLDGAPTATLPRDWKRVHRHFKRFEAAVRMQLDSAGLLDRDRAQVRRRTLAFAFALLGLTVLCAAGGALLATRFGPWPLAVPLAVGLASVIGFVLASATSLLSNEGARRGARWRAYRKELKRSTAAEDSSFAANAGRVLPLAMAFGLGAAWSKAMKRHHAPTPEWFRGLSGSDPAAIAALVAVGAPPHGGAGAGAAASGAAGGGASGAG
jgi:hypothetical protein